MGSLNKSLLVASLGQMFAGLGGKMSNAVANMLKADMVHENPNSRKCGGSRWNNKSNVSNHKWDLHHSHGDGYGTFKNRTTGEFRKFKIANPVNKHPHYKRELSVSAQVYFGLAERDIDGNLVRLNK